MYVIGVEVNGKLDHILAKVYWTKQEAIAAMATSVSEGKVVLELHTLKTDR
jgi:hypothetical protein